MRISDWSSDVCSSDLTPIRILGIDAVFYGPASELHLFLRKGQRLTGCHPDHLFHQIKASDALGYWVLNLKTRIHFQEIEALVGPHDEFDRSEEHTSELQSLMRISYAVFCLKKKTTISNNRVTLAMLFSLDI